MDSKVMKTDSTDEDRLGQSQIEIFESCVKDKVDALYHKCEHFSQIDGLKLKRLMIQSFGVKPNQIVEVLA